MSGKNSLASWYEGGGAVGMGGSPNPGWTGSGW